MTKAKRTLALLVLNSTVGLWATPSAAQEANPVNAVCADAMCTDTAAVHGWPLHPRNADRFANRHAAAR